MAEDAGSRVSAAALDGLARGPTDAPRPSQFRLARNLLVLLALLLPFELPLFRLGPLEITSVELVLYATLACWGIGTAIAIVSRPRSSLLSAARALGADPTVRAVALWFAVLVSSALAAPSYRAAALKFALRSLSGILIFFAARALLSSPAIARRVLVALTAGALVSASTALLELVLPSTGSLWSLFRKGTFDVLGLLRASGVFGYPTMGAMYWEATMPLLLVAPFVGAAGSARLRAPAGRRRLRKRAVLAILGCAFLVGAIIASATRSGLAGSAIGCFALCVLSWRLDPDLRRAAACVVILIAASWLIVQNASGYAGSVLGERMRWWRDETWLRAECDVGSIPSAVQAGESFVVNVVVRNAGSLPWARSGDRSVQLSYHWKRLAGPTTLGDFEGIRTELPADIPPGGAEHLAARVRAPAAEGAYRLQWDLVVEGVTWFSQRDHAMAEEEIWVEPAPPGAPLPGPDSREAPLLDPGPPSRPALWRAAIVLWRQRPILGVGPDNFRRRWQAVLSPSPTGRPYTDVRIHANSLYFETLADLGLAGAAALGAIALALVRLIRLHCVTNGLAGLGCGLAAAAFFVHGTLDYFLEFTPLFGLFWLLLGLTAAYATHAAPPGSPG